MRRLAVWLVLLMGLVSVSLAQEHKETGEGKHEEAAEKDMTAWKWGNFAILAIGIGFLLVKQAGPYFSARSAEIRKGIAEADQLRADAEARAAAMDARLANLGVEVEAMRTSARDEAAQEGQRIRQETEREMAKIQAHADTEIASAVKAAQIDLKAYSAQLAINLARKKVLERMTSSRSGRPGAEFRGGPGSSKSKRSIAWTRHDPVDIAYACCRSIPIRQSPGRDPLGNEFTGASSVCPPAPLKAIQRGIGKHYATDRYSAFPLSDANHFTVTGSGPRGRS